MNVTEDRSLTRRQLLKGAALLASLVPAGALLSGCDASADANDPAASDAATEPASSPDPGSVLVAFYSAQGHTERVAQAAADALGADLFAITPAEPYSNDDLNYNDSNSRVSREHEDESLRAVELEQVTPDGWDGYDTVLLGYPIWWGIAAWPTDGFVSGNDFSGKTVIPFCTSASSPIGESGSSLAELAGTGDWQEGQRFSSGAEDDEVTSWAQGLEL